MDLGLKHHETNGYSAEHCSCDVVSVDPSRFAVIKAEPIDYSTLAEADSEQVKSENVTAAIADDFTIKQEPHLNCTDPCITSFHSEKSSKCHNSSNVAKYKRISQTRIDELSEHNKSLLQKPASPLELVDIEEQLSTMTHLSVIAHKRSRSSKSDTVCSAEVYQCNECKFRSSRKYMLRKHIKIHMNDKPYSCSKCDYRSVTMRSLQKHLITHMPEKPYKCSKCSYTGSRKLYLDVHMRTHIVNSSYKCSACEYTASQRSTLTKHFNVMHLFLPG